jgi:glucose/arabinose dehydrogenase
MKARRLALVGACSAALVAGGLAAPAGATATFSPVVTGLNSPRGIAFDGLGSMYVAESGVPYQGDPGISMTGRVSKWAQGSSSPSWQRSFESLHASEDGEHADALGPEGISALGRGCMKRSNGQRNGCQVRMIMSLGHRVVEAESGGTVSSNELGWLYRLDGASGAPTKLANIGDQDYQWTSDHRALFPDDFPDSNPYAVLVTRIGGDDGIRTFVADAGANTISEVLRDGTQRVIAYIPNESAPPFRDATPTCITQGPDGMLYVGTLHLVNAFTNGPGGADVWRVNPDATFPTAPTLWAHGLTTVSSCTFDRANNFWATEMFAPSDGPPGDVVKIPFSSPTSQTRYGAGSLPLPGGIAQGPDGDMYITVGSAGGAGQGAVMRLHL